MPIPRWLWMAGGQIGWGYVGRFCQIPPSASEQPAIQPSQRRRLQSNLTKAARSLPGSRVVILPHSSRYWQTCWSALLGQSIAGRKQILAHSVPTCSTTPESTLSRLSVPQFGRLRRRENTAIRVHPAVVPRADCFKLFAAAGSMMT